MKTFKFRCRFCRQKMEAEEAWIGLMVECPDCSRPVVIEREEAETRTGPIDPIPPADAFDMPETATQPGLSRTEAPQPFPKPFSIELPEWKLPGK